jgi:hypothetical protein
MIQRCARAGNPISYALLFLCPEKGVPDVYSPRKYHFLWFPSILKLFSRFNIGKSISNQNLENFLSDFRSAFHPFIKNFFIIVPYSFPVILDGPAVDCSPAPMTVPQALQQHYAKGCYVKECTNMFSETTVDHARHQSLLQKGVDLISKSDRTFCSEHRGRAAQDFLFSHLSMGTHAADIELSEASHIKMGPLGFSRHELVRHAQGLKDFCLIQMPGFVIIGRKLSKKLINKLQRRAAKELRYDLV